MPKTEEQLRKDWKYGLGMCQMDGGKPSQLLIELSEQHIRGEITHDEITKRLNEHYTNKKTGA